MFYYSTSFDDLDLLRESVVDWSLDFMPLGASNFNFKITQAILDKVMAGRGIFTGKLEQQGLTPAGFRTFVISANERVTYNWRGRQLDGNSLSLFPPHGELYSISDSSFDVFTISFHKDLFHKVLAVKKNSQLERVVAGENDWKLDEQSIWGLRQLAKRFLNTIATNGILGNQAEELLHAIFNTIEVHEGTKLKVVGKRKHKVLRDTTAWLRNNAEKQVKIKELYESLRLNERTVQNMFKQEFGISPKRYMNNYRIRQVHKLLKTNDLNLTIGDIAAQQGFWHFGQFARDYKALIGELPSETRKIIR